MIRFCVWTSMTSQYVNGKVWKISEFTESVTKKRYVTEPNQYTLHVGKLIQVTTPGYFAALRGINLISFDVIGLVKIPSSITSDSISISLIVSLTWHDIIIFLFSWCVLLPLLSYFIWACLHSFVICFDWMYIGRVTPFPIFVNKVPKIRFILFLDFW